LENQRTYYEDKICSNPDCEFVGIYCDEGKSGINPNREGLQQMMSDARDGKLDLILTKSISRFARNTRVVLEYVRELQELDVTIIFEEQGLDSSSGEGEVMLTLLAAFAEEESRNVSDNLKWSERKRCEQGILHFSHTDFLGYNANKNGKLVVVEEEAELVRRIYREYLSGKSAYRIAKELNMEGVTSPKVERWSGQRLLRMICNEKYKGDCLLQKSFVSEVTGKQKKNEGELPQYYIKNDHEAIVNREDWEKAVAMRKAASKKRKPYPLAGLLHCPYCGGNLRRKLKWKDKYWWVCSTYIVKGIAVCKGIKVDETIILAAGIKEEVVVKEVEQDGKKNFCFIPIAEWQWDDRKEETAGCSILPSIIKQRRTALKLSKPGKLL
jgi:DNA invertase Pin-like site-specific DNA recombinase